MHTLGIRSAFCAAVLLLSGTALAADKVTEIEPKTHVLFMGANIFVEKDKGFRPVEDVTATSVLIKVDGKQVKVPLSDAVNLNIAESLKISGTNVEIHALKIERAYMIGSDPFEQVARSASLAASNTAASDISRGDALRAGAMVVTAGGVVATNATEGNISSREMTAQDMGRAVAMQAQADAAFSQSLDAPVSQVYDVGGQAVKGTGNEKYDAIRITFELKPEKDLKQPYLGVIAQIRDAGSKPGLVRKWAYVQALGALSAGETKNVLIYRGGFPAGYALENCEVHLYSAGEEVATNLSRKRVPLTDSEALDYRIIEYVGANKGRTLPAAFVTTRLPANLRDSLTSEQRLETYYVRVGRDGRVTATFRDTAAKQALQDAPVESVLKTLRFKPALEAGKPVESIMAVNLAQLGPAKKSE